MIFMSSGYTDVTIMRHPPANHACARGWIERAACGGAFEERLIESADGHYARDVGWGNVSLKNGTLRSSFGYIASRRMVQCSVAH
jgi:hypothetical protein